MDNEKCARSIGWHDIGLKPGTAMAGTLRAITIGEKDQQFECLSETFFMAGITVIGMTNPLQ
jgi:hypothetical protein